MNDQELLTYAAKAAGYQLDRDGDLFLTVEHHKAGKNYYPWNPLEDDADAFQLMVKLNMKVYAGEAYPCNKTTLEWDKGICVDEDQCADVYEATRRAIVMVAAEIGKGM